MIACSNSGGTWGAKLKYAGWDAIIVEGKADKPVRIHIDDDKVALLPADEYWADQRRGRRGAQEALSQGGGAQHRPRRGDRIADGLHHQRQGSRGRPQRRRRRDGLKNLKAISVVAKPQRVMEPFDAGKAARYRQASLAKSRKTALPEEVCPPTGPLCWSTS